MTTQVPSIPPSTQASSSLPIQVEAPQPPALPLQAPVLPIQAQVQALPQALP
jgi:hypothetical protein